MIVRIHVDSLSPYNCLASLLKIYPSQFELKIEISLEDFAYLAQMCFPDTHALAQMLYLHYWVRNKRQSSPQDEINYTNEINNAIIE